MLIFWLILKALRYFRDDDFKWWNTVASWNDLREKLDGLTNAIYKHDFDQSARQGTQLGRMPTMPLSQTPLIDQSTPTNHAPSPPEPTNSTALGITAASGQYAISTGYFPQQPVGRLPLERPERTYEAAQTGQYAQWYDQQHGPAAGPSQQWPRRRNSKD